MRLLFGIFSFCLLGMTAVTAYYTYSASFNSSYKTPERIIALSPSVTEVLYFLDKWDRVGAVSRYCVFPPEAAEKPEVGGIQDINYEAVIAMAPDLVILSDMQTEGEERLRSLGIETLLVYQHTFEDVLASIQIIGDRIGAQERAKTLVAELEVSVQDILAHIPFHEKRSAVFVMSRDVGDGVNSLVVAGNDGYYSRILEFLGAENPFAGGIAYATVSKEGLYEVNPDAVIELVYVPELAVQSVSEWQSSMPQIRAVRHGRVCAISDSFGYVPGPRFPLLLDAVARCIYPEVFK